MITKKQKYHWLTHDLPVVATIVVIALTVMIVCMLVLPKLHFDETKETVEKSNNTLLIHIGRQVHTEIWHNSSKTNQQHGGSKEARIIAKGKEPFKIN